MKQTPSVNERQFEQLLIPQEMQSLLLESAIVLAGHAWQLLSPVDERLMGIVSTTVDKEINN